MDEQLTIEVEQAAIDGWRILDRFRQEGWTVTFLPLPGFAGGPFVEVNGGWGRVIRKQGEPGETVGHVAPRLLAEARAVYGVQF